MKYNNVEIEMVNCECTDIKICRAILTAISEKIALYEAVQLSGFGIITASPIQVCIEGLVPPSQTPDGRSGVVIQFNVPDAVNMEKFSKALLERLFMIPHLPTCSLFDSKAEKKEVQIDIGENIRRWGDGFETAEQLAGRDVYRIPIMTGDMLVERNLEVVRGMDAALEVFAENAGSCVVAAQEAACRVFHEVPGVALFNYPVGGISGAKVGGINYTRERVTINEPYCPTLRNRISKSKVPDGAGAVIEFPMIGLNEEKIRKGLQVAIEAFTGTPGVLKITSPSFGGQWGARKLYLPEIVGSGGA
jgi:formylmethanofuran--tetrahydromethanopterin N-formyltransferase